MSISFSGLASGLDTSSWIKSLTALKQAKVTTLEEEKSQVQTSLDTLSNIKTFFNSFRSLLEKVTDTKFNVGSMDLFSQKLVTSSNTKLLTANVTSAAQEGKYDIKVSTLASNTSAVSGYKEAVTSSTTVNATSNTQLKNLGVKSGNISVNGTLVRVYDTDTITGFAQKLNNIGVQAEFDSSTGIFSINNDLTKINDVDNTGIVSGLRLSSVNHGYISKPLQKYWTEVVTDYANEDTLLSKLGVRGGDITVVANDGQPYKLSIEAGDTIGDIINALDSVGISASIEDGVFSLHDGYVYDEGSTMFIGALGLDSSASEKVYISNAYEPKTTLNATGTTTLRELGITASASLTFAIMTSTGQTVHTMNADDTLNDFFQRLSNFDISASINNGVITIKNNGDAVVKSTGLASALGISLSMATVTIGHTQTSTAPVTSTVETLATYDTTMRQLGVEGGVIGYIRNDDNSVQTRYTITSDTTLREFSNMLNGSQSTSNLYFSISNGMAYLEYDEGDGYYRLDDITGTVLKDLGLSPVDKYVTTTVGGTWSSSVQVTYTATVRTTTTAGNTVTSSSGIMAYANLNTKLSDLGITDFSYKRVSGGRMPGPTMSMSSSATLGDFLDLWNSNATLQDGRIVCQNSFFIISSEVTQLLMGDATVTGSGMNAMYSYDSTPTLKVAATGATTLAELGITSNQTIELGYNSSSRITQTFSTTSTIDDVVTFFNSNGFLVMPMSSGGGYGLSITPSSYAYPPHYISSMTSDLRRALNLNSATFYSTSISTTTATTMLTTATKFSELGLSTDQVVTVYSAGTEKTITVTTATTVGTLASRLRGYGFTATVSNGVFTIGGKDNYWIRDFNDTLDKCLKLPDKYNTTAYTTKMTTLKINPTTVSTVGTKLTVVDKSITLDTKIVDIEGASTGNMYITDKNGTARILKINSSMTVGELFDSLKTNGITGIIESNGTVTFNCEGDAAIVASRNGYFNPFTVFKLPSSASPVMMSKRVNSASSTPITYTTGVDKDSLVTELGITTGNVRVKFDDGTYFTYGIGTKTKVSDLISAFESNGLGLNLVVERGTATLIALSRDDRNFTFETPSNASNLRTILQGQTVYNQGQSIAFGTKTVVHTGAVTEDTKLAEIQNPLSVSYLYLAGGYSVVVDGVEHIWNLSSNETFGSLINRFKEVGVNAAIVDNKFSINAGSKTISVQGCGISSNGYLTPASGLSSELGMTYSDKLAGFASSSSRVMATQSSSGFKEVSAANYITMDTKLKDLNVTTGTFSVFLNGAKRTIMIEEDDTLQDLQNKLSPKPEYMPPGVHFIQDIRLGVANGKLSIVPLWAADTITAGVSTDTSNILSVLGLQSEGSHVVSARELYIVNGNSKLTDHDLFRAGTVTEGTFKVGNAEFEITNDTTLNSLISQINSSQEATATAYWDSVKGEFVIKSRTTGSVYVNIEAGTSNFTDILGFTSTTRNSDDSIKSSKLELERQKLGDSARFSINGTDYTSTSNVITSDISRIEGLTFNLKDISKDDETVTIEITQDKSAVSSAMDDIVNAYNDLIDNVDKEVARGGNLSNQSTLKLIRNQIRSFMTSSFSGNSAYRNLDAIGIQLEAASANNIRTGNINRLSFNKEKFEEALQNNQNSVKTLLVGDDTTKGILTRVEDLLEQTLSTGTGYFSSAEKSYNNKIERYNNKITKATASVERYRALLEKKFKNMDSLIAKMQQQYSSFLSL